MASTEKECAYVECDKVFYGGKRAMYCCDKHGQYQRRLNSKAKFDEMEKLIKRDL